MPMPTIKYLDRCMLVTSSPSLITPRVLYSISIPTGQVVGWLGLRIIINPCNGSLVLILQVFQTIPMSRIC